MGGEQLLEDLKRTIATMETFTELGKTITSTLDIKEVMQVFLTKVYDLLSPTSWMLYLVDDSNKFLRYEVLVNEPYVDGSTTIPIGTEISGWVAEASRPILWPRLESLPSGISVPEGVRSLLCVPLTSKGKTFGVIEVRRKGNDILPYGQEDLMILSSMADFASVAIENALNFQKVQELMIMDDLTCAFNARHLHTLLQSEIARSYRYKKIFSVIFLDLDHFKKVVNEYGHMHASQLLRETAQLILDHVETVDYVFRYGGDEFVILLPEKEKKEALEVAEKLRKTISGHDFLAHEGKKARFSASFGVATYPQDAQTKDDLIRLADQAMYEIKHTTRNGVKAT